VATPGDVAVKGLNLEDISVGFGPVTVLRGVTCYLAEGRVYALIGANGAGKSTLLDCLSGFLPTSAGEIRFGGSVTSRRSRLRLAARLHQRTVVPEPLSCADFLRVAAEPRSATWLLGRWRTEAATDVKLDPVRPLLEAGRIPLTAVLSELSGGQRRLVALSAVLLTQKPVLLLDEPFAGISSGIESVVRSVIRHHAAGRVVVVAEHGLDVVERLSDDVIILQGGRISDVRSSRAIDRTSLVPHFGG
jgi:ABC-type multidrug transport system ATPase subunit